MKRIRTAVVINGWANGEKPDFEEVRPDFCPACGHEVIDDEEYKHGWKYFLFSSKMEQNTLANASIRCIRIRKRGHRP